MQASILQMAVDCIVKLSCDLRRLGDEVARMQRFNVAATGVVSTSSQPAASHQSFKRTRPTSPRPSLLSPSSSSSSSDEAPEQRHYSSSSTQASAPATTTTAAPRQRPTPPRKRSRASVDDDGAKDEVKKVTTAVATAAPAPVCGLGGGLPGGGSVNYVRSAVTPDIFLLPVWNGGLMTAPSESTVSSTSTTASLKLESPALVIKQVRFVTNFDVIRGIVEFRVSAR